MNIQQRKKIYVAMVLACAMITGACSNKHNTWLSRTYQHYTSAFNVFFNGNEAFKQGVQSVRENCQNDYSKILPVYEISDESAAKRATGDMTTALQKAHKLIELHSITVKPARKQGELTERDRKLMAKEEYNPLVPEAYLLIGKANVVMHEEQEAIEIFDFLLAKHGNEHASFEGLIWKSIAMCQIGQPAQAQSALEAYDIQGIAPADLFEMYEVARANLYLNLGKYAEAIPHLKSAIEETRDSILRRRLKYILAQVCRELGDNAEAARLFDELARNMGDFDMAFAAKLDLATVSVTPEEVARVNKMISKMLKDPSYDDKQDQLYYALGNAALSQNEDKAIELFRTSIGKSTDNINQRGLSFWALEQIYIRRPDYTNAGIAADSAREYISETVALHADVEKVQKKLHPLTEELRVIANADSLLMLVSLDAKQLEERLTVMLNRHNDEIDRREAIAAAEAEAGNEGMSEAEFMRTTQGSQKAGAGKTGGSNWYFYNQTMISAGKSQFRTKWGRRPNEDNWRRSNKQQSALSDVNAADNSGSGENNPEGLFGDDALLANAKESETTEAGGLKDDERWTMEQLMATLPTDQQTQNTLRKEREESLYKSAVMLYDNIADNKAAIAQMNRLLELYPETAHRYDALAIEYFAAGKSDDEQTLQQARTLLLKDYAQSPMAERIRQGKAVVPGAYSQYEKVYADYLTHQYSSVISQTETLGEGDEVLRPKVLLVRALAYGKSGMREQMKQNLEMINLQYSGCQPDSVARILLAQLAEGKSPLTEEQYKSPLDMRAAAGQEALDADAENRYQFAPDSAQMVLLVIDAQMANRAQFVVADYNFSNFLLRDFDIQLMALPGGKQVLLISGFESLADAKQYFYALREQPFMKEITSEPLPPLYICSDNNIKPCLAYNVEEAYVKFFEENYLGRRE